MGEKVYCVTCQGTGQATIEIEKEWVECPECSQAPESFDAYNCKTCKNQDTKSRKEIIAS